MASTTARFALPEVRRGLVASAGGLVRATRALPPNVARELLIGGLVLGPERGYELGLVNRLAEPGGAVDAAIELAGQITPNAPLVLEATKAVLQANWPEDVFWDKQGEATGPVFTSEDAREGSIAFAEKRPPVWKWR